MQFVVAPHETDGQIAFLCNEQNKRAPGTALAATKDSDLALNIEKVFFWDPQYDKKHRLGGGLLCIKSEMIARKDGNKSTKGFTDLQFTLMCVLCGCDYVSKEDHASGVGFVRAVVDGSRVPDDGRRDR